MQNQPIFKMTDLDRYVGIINIRHNVFTFQDSIRINIEIGGGSTSSHGRLKSLHDIHIGLDDGIKIALRSNKPKAVTPKKWLTKKSVEKIV